MYMKCGIIYMSLLRGRAAVARRAHNPEVTGSIPVPAPIEIFISEVFIDFTFFVSGFLLIKIPNPSKISIFLLNKITFDLSP